MFPWNFINLTDKLPWAAYEDEVRLHQKEQKLIKTKWNLDEKTEERKQEQRLSKLDTSKDLKNNSSLKRISVNEIKEEQAKETKWVSPSIR